MENPHLALLGGKSMPRSDYLQLLAKESIITGPEGAWTAHFPNRNIADYLAKTRMA
jgi:Leu/Phe-tRNA-protein transferase